MDGLPIAALGHRSSPQGYPTHFLTFAATAAPARFKSRCLPRHPPHGWIPSALAAAASRSPGPPVHGPRVSPHTSGVPTLRRQSASARHCPQCPAQRRRQTALEMGGFKAWPSILHLTRAD